MDFNELAGNLGLEESEFLEFVELFLETSGCDLDELKDGAVKGDARLVVEAAHSIKGAASNLGFSNISDAASDVEIRARENRLEGVIEAITEIREKIDHLAEGYQSRRESATGV